MSLTKEQILLARDIKREEVHVPEWDGSVFISVMTGTDRDQWEGDLRKRSDRSGNLTNMENLRATLLAKTITDEAGNRIFNDNGDIEALGKKSSAVLDRLFEVSQRVNRLRPEDVEELAKNS